MSQVIIVQPQLTTVEQPLMEMGRIAAGLMLEKLSDPAAPPRKVVLRAGLKIRQST